MPRRTAARTPSALEGLTLKNPDGSAVQPPDPNAARGRLPEVERLAARTESHRLIVFAVQDFKGCGRAQAKPLQKLEKLRIFFVDADNLSRVLGAQVREQQGALLSELCDSSAHGDAMRTAFLVAETLQ